jgi:hypothetical protein
MVQVVSEENLRKLNQRQMNKRDVNIKLPRFKFEYEVELTERLQEMGISLPFTDNADFSAMVAPDSPAQCAAPFFFPHSFAHSRASAVCGVSCVYARCGS